MMKTEMFFWGGLSTIGGNIIEIRYGKDRVIFDFGLNYNPADVLLANARGRKNKRVADMLKLNMIPKIEGIYEAKDIELTKLTLKSESESDFNTAIFVSHLHLDHMGAIDTISPNIPVYFSKESKELYEQLVKVGEGPFKALDEIKTFNYKEPIEIGQIKVTGYQIDHDVHGSSAILVETPDKSFCYSGDIRMHGRRPELNEIWLEEMRIKNVDYLLMEGTTFQPKRDHVDEKQPKRITYSEPEITDIFVEKLKAATGVAFFNFYHRNLERLNALIEASVKTERTIVFETATAQIASVFFPSVAFKILEKNTEETPLAKWEQKLYETYETITIQQLNENPSAYFVQNSFENILSLVDYKLEGSIYIHSNGTPLGAFDPAYASMLSFLSGLNVSFEPVHVSGHANKEAILEMIDKIKPKTLVPWHSLDPKLVVPLDSEQVVFHPELKTWY